MRIAEQDRKKLLNKRKAFDDGRARAAQFVSKLQEDYPWILQEKQFFNRTGSDYDFAAKDPVAQKARRKELQEEQATLSKKVCFAGQYVGMCALSIDWWMDSIVFTDPL